VRKLTVLFWFIKSNYCKYRLENFFAVVCCW